MQGETQAERRISGLTIPWLSSFRFVEAFLFHVETFLFHAHLTSSVCITPVTRHQFSLMVATVESLALAFLADDWFVV
jgi:hypothetical protein